LTGPKKTTSELGYRESNPGLLREQSTVGTVESQRCYRYTIPDGNRVWFRFDAENGRKQIFYVWSVSRAVLVVGQMECGEARFRGDDFSRVGIFLDVITVGIRTRRDPLIGVVRLYGSNGTSPS
jgi:hypothetical protein